MQALWARLAIEEARGAGGVSEVSLARMDAGGEEAERGAEVMAIRENGELTFCSWNCLKEYKPK